MTQSAPLSVLENLINHYLHLDSDATSLMTSLDGRSILVEVEGTRARVMVCFEGARVALMEAQSGARGDAQVGGSPIGLVRALRNVRSGGGFGSDLRISGDVEVMADLRRLSTNLDVDWEEHLSEFIGDSGAHGFGALARAFGAWRSKVEATLLRDLGEYLEEESRLTPSRDELDAFSHSVDVMRDDVERFAQRVKRLSDICEVQTG